MSYQTIVASTAGHKQPRPFGCDAWNLLGSMERLT